MRVICITVFRPPPPGAGAALTPTAQTGTLRLAEIKQFHEVVKAAQSDIQETALKRLPEQVPCGLWGLSRNGVPAFTPECSGENGS